MPASSFRGQALLLLASLVSGRAWAQAVPEASSTGSERGYTLGRLHLYPKLLLRNAGVSTNVYNTQSGVIPDSSLALSPFLAGQMRVGRRFRLNGQGQVDFVWFRRETSERSVDYAARGTAEADVGPLTFSFGGGGGQYRQRFSIDIDERLLRQEKRIEAGVALRASRRFTFTGTIGARESRFEPGVQVEGSNVSTTLDRDSRSFDGSVSYRLSNQTSFVGSVTLTEDRFLHEVVPALRLTQSRGYFAGFDFGGKALLTGRVRVGVREYPASRAGGSPPYRGPALGVDVGMPVFRFGRLTLAADRDVFYAVQRAPSAEGLLRNSYVSGRYAATLGVGLPLDLIGSVTSGFEQARYLLPLVSGGARYNRVDHLYTLGGSLVRRLGDHVRLGVGATFFRRVSNFEGFSYESVTYGLTGEAVP